MHKPFFRISKYFNNIDWAGCCLIFFCYCFEWFEPVSRSRYHAGHTKVKPISGQRVQPGDVWVYTSLNKRYESAPISPYGYLFKGRKTSTKTKRSSPNRTEQNKTKQNKIKQNRAKQSACHCCNQSLFLTTHTRTHHWVLLAPPLRSCVFQSVICIA